MSVRSSALDRWLRIPLLVVGVTSAVLALWTFYFRPWLWGTSRLDPWLDRHRCAISALCTKGFTPGGQPGILAALVAILYFGLVLWRWPGVWMSDDPPTIPLAWPSRSLWLTRSLWLAFFVGFGAIVYQAYQTLSGHTLGPLVWLVGMGAFFLAAVLWDAARPADLACTLAGIIVAVGIGLIVLGVACVMAKRTAAVPLLASGGVAFIAGSRWTTRAGSLVHPLEHIAMLALTLMALVMTMSRVWSWRFALIGDEWAFFKTASILLHQPGTFELLGLRGDPNNYHTVLSSAVQAWVMQLVGEDVFGWRLSSVLPFVLSVPPIYVLLRWLAGREAAFLGAASFASSHVLLTFSLAAYNNTQALLSLALGLGFFAFASQRASVLRYLLVGVALGLGFFAFGLARLAVLPVGLLLLAFGGPLRKRTLPGWVPAAVGGLAASAPMSFHLANWRAMLKATPVRSEVADRGVSVSMQVARNAFRGLLAFLSGSSNTHFIAGPHTDPLTALLMLIGLSCALVGLVRYKRARVWLLASGLFVVMVSAIQQYISIANTRMFILPAVYAVFAGLGGAALARLLVPENTIARSALLGTLAVVGVGLNLIHVEWISLPNSIQPAETLIIQQLQATEAPDRGGMPAFIVMETTSRIQRENMIARAYDVGRERLIFLDPTEALALPHLCLVGEQPAMVLVDARNSQIDVLQSRIEACWPGYEKRTMLNHMQREGLYCFLTVKGQQELKRPGVQRRSERQKPDTLAVVDPGDVVVSRNGTVYVLSLTEARVYRFAPDGKPLGEFMLVQDAPSAMALTPEGSLLVASVGSGSRLVWYDTDGTVIRRAPPNLAIGGPRGLAVGGNGDIFVADGTGAYRVVHLSPRGEVIGRLAGGGRIKRPCSVALGPDESIWVLDAGGQLLQLSPQDGVLTILSVPETLPERPWRMLLASNGDLIMTEPGAQRVVRRDAQGRVVRVWSGFERPVGLTADAAGRLFVSDWALDQVGILPPLTDGPEPVAATGRESSRE